MRFCRFDDDRLGVVEGDSVRDVSEALALLPEQRWPLSHGDLLIAHLDRLRPEMDRLARTAPSRPLTEVRLLSPVANPGKIVAAPVNYQLHLDEVVGTEAIHHNQQIRTIQEVGLFLKAPSSVVGPGEGVVVDWDDRRTDHEVELALVIGRRGFRISEQDALSHVAGYLIGLDMTVRGPEERSYRKSLDTFTVLGPWIVTADEVADPNALDLRLTVNGEPRQGSNTSKLIFNVQRLIAYASRAYTLHPGDVIMTGTPEGVAPVKPGDIIEAEIDGIGRMQVAVRGDHTPS